MPRDHFEMNLLERLSKGERDKGPAAWEHGCGSARLLLAVAGMAGMAFPTPLLDDVGRGIAEVGRGVSEALKLTF